MVDIPLKLTFRDMEKDPEIEHSVREKLARLDSLSESITGCSAAIEKPQEHQKAGNPYRVRLVITAAGRDIVVVREPGDSPMHAPLISVVHDAFNAARRQLIEKNEKRRRDVKRHPAQETGALVDSLFREEGYGFLRTRDDRRIYFHKNSVLHNDFDRLEPGTGVRYVETSGEKGPQASTVQIVDKPGVRTRAPGAPQEDTRGRNRT